MKLCKHLSPIALLLASQTGLADTLIVERATLLSAERSQPLKNAYVQIDDGRISRVSDSPIKTKGPVTRIDAKGQYLMPGLMDSHVHVSTMPGLAMDKSGKNRADMKHLQQKFVEQQPKSYLYFGVTQMVDPGQSKASLVEFNSQPIRPDIFFCGASPIMGGYPTVWASEETNIERFEFLIHEPTPGKPAPKGINPARHTPEAVVERMAEEGAICTKVYIEDGFGNNSHWPLPSQNSLKRLQAAAKKHGLKMMAHANAIDMQDIAKALDVDVITHGMWNWNEFDGAEGLPGPIKQILDQIIAQAQVFQATFNVMDGIKGLTVPNVLDDPLYDKVVTPEAMKWYKTDAGQWFAKEMIRDYGDRPLATIHHFQDITISQGERVVAYLAEQGHPMVLASDTPSSPTFAAQPGLSTFQELRHMAKAGVTLPQIFAAATLNNATAFNLQDSYGTVEPGKIANLLLLDANPLTSVEAYNQIDKVILRGEVIERETLAADYQPAN